MTKAWFETSDKLDKEIKDFSDLGIAYKLDEKLKEEEKILRIFLIVKKNEYFDLPDVHHELHLVVTYPDLYPYFRPEVFAYDLELPRHQNPFGKNLCLLERNTGAWKPSWTVAEYLKEQLPKLLVEGYITEAKELEGKPREQAEPVSIFYDGPDTPILFNSNAFGKIEEKDAVEFLANIQIGIPKKSDIPPERFAALKITDKNNTILYEISHKLKSLFPQTLVAPVFALPGKPPNGEAEKDYHWFLDLLSKEDKKSLGRSRLSLQNGQKIQQIIGFCFPEETEPGINSMTGWLFLVHVSFPKVIQSRGRNKKTDQSIFYYIKATKTNAKDYTIRIPKLKDLSQKKIGIVGLGALGGSAAIEFARSGVGKLILLDYDIVEAATSVRWALGLSAAGLKKVDAISEFIEINYPSTNLKSINHRIGTIRVNGEKEVNKDLPIEQDLIDQLYNDSDLIFDATAEIGISHFLSEEAISRNIPYVMIHATPGALGGLVMRIIPSKTPGCWMCLQCAKADSTIPAPPQEDEGVIQQPGCADITFTGANFDLQNVTLAGVRMAISTLLLGHEDGYPDTNFDVGILKMVDDEKNAIFPAWETHSLDVHPQCPYCSNES